MRLSVAGVAIAAVCAAGVFVNHAGAQSPIAPASVARPETAARFLEVSGVERAYDQSFETTLRSQLATNPQLSTYADAFRRFAAKFTSYDALKPKLVQLYRTTMSEADLEAAVRFYESPAGRRLTTASPQLAAQTYALAQRELQAHLPELKLMIDAQAKRQAAGAAQSPKR